MVKRISLVFAVVFFVTLLVACADEQQLKEEGQESSEKQKENLEQENTVDPEEQAASVNTYPFTGIGTDEKVTRRAVAVMVNNHRKARPQSGLTQADIVFEILAEGNITRLMAIFQSESPAVVGPVRSAREYYFNLASGYGALYVYHGAADFIEEQLRSGIIDNLNGSYYDNDGYLFERAGFRVAPHNSYLQFGAVYKEAEKQGYAVKTNHEMLPFLSTEAAADIQGEEASGITFYYNSTPVRYVYDSALEKYLRYNGDNQTVELETEEAVQLDNVFIVETSHQVIDEQGRRAIDLKSGGDAYLLQKGKLQKIQWENVEGKIIPFQDGKPVGFVPGKTWINVIPKSTGLGQITID